MLIIRLNKESLNKAVKIIKDGGVVVFPTDTVYGFLADAQNKKAVERIYKTKNRPKTKPLPVFVKDLSAAKRIAFVDTEQEKTIKKFWPGSVTFILKRKSAIKLFGQNKQSIALRVPRHNFLTQLLKMINKPLVQTSVNISGQPPFKKGDDIYTFFDKQKYQPDLIVDGGELKKSPSKIIDLTKEPKILRP